MYAHTVIAFAPIRPPRTHRGLMPVQARLGGVGKEAFLLFLGVSSTGLLALLREFYQQLATFVVMAAGSACLLGKVCAS